VAGEGLVQLADVRKPKLSRTTNSLLAVSKQGHVTNGESHRTDRHRAKLYQLPLLSERRQSTITKTEKAVGAAVRSAFALRTSTTYQAAAEMVGFCELADFETATGRSSREYV
jgi:hypothetical protein